MRINESLTFKKFYKLNISVCSGLEGKELGLWTNETFGQSIENSSTKMDSQSQ